MSILPLLSKVYERVMYEQTSNYFEPFLYEILCGFRKPHSNIRKLIKHIRNMLYLNYQPHGEIR